jgi:hypothetical protein
MALAENPAERAERYIQSFEGALAKNRILTGDVVVKSSNILRVSDAIGRYLRDARHYLKDQKPTTSLVSVAYAEGLFDALLFLEVARPLE